MPVRCYVGGPVPATFPGLTVLSERVKGKRVPEAEKGSVGPCEVEELRPAPKGGRLPRTRKRVPKSYRLEPR